MAGRYEIINVPRRHKEIILNPTLVPDGGMLLRRVVCNDKEGELIPTESSHLDWWNGNGHYVLDAVKIPKGIVGVEDGRDQKRKNRVSYTLT